MMNKEFFKLLNPYEEYERPVEYQSKKELYCNKVHMACKELRRELGSEDHHYLTFTKDNLDRVYEVAYRDEVNPMLLTKILFGR